MNKWSMYREQLPGVLPQSSCAQAITRARALRSRPLMIVILPQRPAWKVMTPRWDGALGVWHRRRALCLLDERCPWVFVDPQLEEKWLSLLSVAALGDVCHLGAARRALSRQRTCSGRRIQKGEVNGYSFMMSAAAWFVLTGRKSNDASSHQFIRQNQ